MVRTYKSLYAFQAMREIKNKKPKKPLIVQPEDGSIVGSQKEQITIITKHLPKYSLQKSMKSHQPYHQQK